jgi:hypothetical protein
MTFKLKYLFGLILIVGVALMWWEWCNQLTTNVRYLIWPGPFIEGKTSDKNFYRHVIVTVLAVLTMGRANDGLGCVAQGELEA